MTSFQVPLKMYGARALVYFVKFPTGLLMIAQLPHTPQRQKRWDRSAASGGCKVATRALPDD